MKTTFLSEEIEILRELSQTQKYIELYFLHKKYRLSPIQVIQFIDEFVQLGLIILDSNKIALTEKGRLWVFRNRKAIFLSQRLQYWKSNNYWKERNHYYYKSEEENGLYELNIRNIDKEVFKKKKGN